MDPYDFDPAHYWKRLLIPTILGIASAFMYYKALATKLEPVVFVKLSRAVKPFEMIQRSDLAPIRVHGDSHSLAEGALLWSQIGRVVNAKAARHLYAGDILRLSDIEVDRDRLDYPLQEDEEIVSLQLPDDLGKVVIDIQPGDEIKAMIQSEDGSTAYVGPFRVMELERQNDGNQISVGRIWLVTRRLDENTPDPEFARLSMAATGQRIGGRSERLIQIVRTPGK